jgi:hypothetical protein
MQVTCLEAHVTYIYFHGKLGGLSPFGRQAVRAPSMVSALQTNEVHPNPEFLIT